MRHRMLIAFVSVLLSSASWTKGSFTELPAGSYGGSSGQDKPKIALPLPRQYEYLFSRIAILHLRASFKEQRDGIDGSVYRSLIPARLNLSSGEAAALEEIAFNCLAEVKTIDDKINGIIQKHRAKYPGGRIRKADGVPKPPEELARLQMERRNRFLLARETLRSRLGLRFDYFEATMETYLQRTFVR